MVDFDNTFLRALPEMAEPWKADDHPDPRTVIVADDHAEHLGLDAEWLATADGAAFLTGDLVLEGSEPLAQAYTGHQFGGLSPRLGDGRALLLGEVVDGDGVRHDLHVKGSGRTPFARGGDGRAVLGPMLREFLLCDAMHALGVPTTRALGVATTGETVERDGPRPGATFVRTASSHLRVGSFQYAALHHGPDLVERLLRFAVERHHPDLLDDIDGTSDLALAFLDRVVEAQASLVARWMSLGFVHGVLNTDNVLVGGETIDYGPCAFIDAYDPAAVFSSIDHGGRYALGRQPAITHWNLARLAETLLDLVDDDTDRAIEAVTARLDTFPDRHLARWRTVMADKLAVDPDVADLDALAGEFLDAMHADGVDWTSTWRSLAGAADGDTEPLRSRFVDLERIDEWIGRWTAHLDRSRVPHLDRVNPVYVPRNHLVEEALAAADGGDLAPFHRLHELVTRPFDRVAGADRYGEPAPADFGRYRTFCGT